jgi:protein-S-isoprenylcysteine O-methyltransferase Ste14
MEASNTVLHHPNREKASSKATKSIVILLLLVSAGLVLVVTVGGWSTLQGAQIVSIGYVLVFLAMAWYVNKWNRGVLPLAAALAILLAVVAAIAGPAWFDRDKDGFDNPGLPPGLLGLLTLLIVPVQILLIVFAMRGFTQQWNVEVEMPRDEYDRQHRGGQGGRPQYGGASA